MPRPRPDIPARFLRDMPADVSTDIKMLPLLVDREKRDPGLSLAMRNPGPRAFSKVAFQESWKRDQDALFAALLKMLEAWNTGANRCTDSPIVVPHGLPINNVITDCCSRHSSNNPWFRLHTLRERL